MKYFIDFEAQQYTNEIISIGCVREDGVEFSSLVFPGKKHKKLSKFIKNLTGLTQEQINNAPTIDDVFSNFFDWLSEDKTNIVFYCYGNSDTDFVCATRALAQTIKAQATLCLIQCNLKDYSQNVKKFFGLWTTPSLLKVARYFKQDNSIEQNHAALDDAKLLYSVYLGIQRDEPFDSNPFEAYKKPEPPKNEFDTLNGYMIKWFDKTEACIGAFPCLNDAVKALDDYLKKEFPKLIRPTDELLRKRISTCLRGSGTYFEFSWKLTEKED